MLNVFIAILITFTCRKFNNHSLITTLINCWDVAVIRRVWGITERWNLYRIDKLDKQREIAIHNVSDEFLLEVRGFMCKKRYAFWNSYLSVCPSGCRWLTYSQRLNFWTHSIKTQYLGFTLKFVGNIEFYTILNQNKGHFTRCHWWRFTSIPLAFKSDK